MIWKNGVVSEWLCVYIWIIRSVDFSWPFSLVRNKRNRKEIRRRQCVQYNIMKLSGRDQQRGRYVHTLGQE